MMKIRLRQTYQHTDLTIYMRHKYNTIAAYKQRIILFLDLVNQKSFKFYHRNT